MTGRYVPADAFRSPRFTGIRTYMRLPHVTDLDGVDVAVLGLAFDTATSFRAGARFGPEAIRSASALLRPYNPEQAVDIFAHLSAVDAGKVSLIAGVTPDLVGQVKAGELVNFVAQQVGGKGGGKADTAQAGGTEPAKLGAALASVRGFVEERV